jgi:hypothetical protein
MILAYASSYQLHVFESSSANLPAVTCHYSNPLLRRGDQQSALLIAFPYRNVLAALSAELWAD